MAPAPKKTGQKKTGQTRRRASVVVVVILAIVATAVITWLIAGIAPKDATDGATANPRPDRGAVGFIPVLLVLAFTAVTGVLIFGGLAFNDVGIGNRDEALGMPEGSIRALIAMSLILIFAILSVYLFSESSKERLYVSPGLSREEIRLLQPGSIVVIAPASAAPTAAPGASPAEAVFDVTIRGSLDQASSTLAVQLLATVSTLVVAVAGFYFGTKAVTAAIAATRAGRDTGKEDEEDEDQGQEEAPAVEGTGAIELISPQSPATLAADLDEVFAPVDIELRVEPVGAAVTGTITGDDDGKLETTAPDEFRYTPGPTPEDTVRLKFSLAVPFDASVELEIVQPPIGREGMV